MFGALLIANRGEIARRIIRTARAMGVRTIAVHSDVDAGLPFVREADEAICIGPAPARDSYLDQAKILDAARRSGAEAIHPGYGFLSENADFAEAVQAAGLVWVGAPPAAIRAMGLKDAAKARMIAAGVPVTPGYLGEDQSPGRLAREAEAIGWPVLIKAVAGGGGKGMRRVDAAQHFAAMLQSCRREATASFGDDRVLIEKYVLSPRHIEVQVFGDTHGNVVHLFERDCSLQRRHQKVIEEAPAPGMDAATRATLCATAVKAAEAVEYVGAGTIEFIADASEGLRADRIWFMEMNTRLQVEHPVTEAITGVDLVEWQLRVAAGESLPKTQDELAITGWAIEARLYAEDPANGFLPSIGRLERFRIPDRVPRYSYVAENGVMVHDAELPGRVRIDTGVEQGSTISPFYDPMIAKVICHADARRDAALVLAHVMAATSIWPVRTNASFLHALLVHPDFVRGQVDTGFIDAHAEDVLFEVEPPAPMLDAVAYTLGGADRPFAGFRLNASPETRVAFQDRGVMFSGDAAREPSFNDRGQFALEPVGDAVFATMQGKTWRFRAPDIDATATKAAGDGTIVAPMPGRIIAVAVAPGERVAEGDMLVTLEAMKMEHSLRAPFAGTVAELGAALNAQVADGALLVRIERDA